MALVKISDIASELTSPTNGTLFEVEESGASYKITRANLIGLTTKGDLLTRSSSALSRLGVGSNGQVLTADSAETLGVKWATPSGGGGTPGGSSGELQFNNAGAFGGAFFKQAGDATNPMLQFGGTSSSYPMLKRNGNVLEVKLADDSAYTRISPDVCSPQTRMSIGGGVALESTGIQLNNAGAFTWSQDGAYYGTPDLRAKRAGVNLFGLDDNAGGGAGMELIEMGSDFAAPASNKARWYLRDNGSGKSQLVIRFATGAIQVIATEP